MTCRVCGATSPGGQYCVACGQPLVPAMAAAVATRPQPRQERSTWLDFQEIRLLACPKCGAPNSAARWQCARCGETFDERARADEESAGDTTSPAARAPQTQPEPAAWLWLVTAVAGVAVVAVAVVLVASRGVGPFRTEDATAARSQMTPAGITGVQTSLQALPAEARRAIVDGDPTTAWRVEGDPTGQWVELRLEKPAQIDHLLVWNGDQRDDATFAATNRVREVMISFPDVGKQYTAQFPNVGAHFRVDMIAPPVSNRVRIRIENVYGDAEATAITDIEALVNGSAATTSE